MTGPDPNEHEMPFLDPLSLREYSLSAVPAAPTPMADPPTITVDIDIEGLVEESEEDPGGFIVVRGLRQKIILSAYGSGNVTLSRQPIAPDHKVYVYDAAAGGTALLDETRDETSFPIGSLPRHLWVEGVNASTALRDVWLTLAGSGSGESDRVKLTVLDLELDDGAG